MENLETRPLEVAFAPEECTRRSFFRDVPWRWSDVVVCLAPDIAFWVSRGFWPGMLAGAPRWLWLPLTLLGQVWMLAYPLWIARRHRGELPRWPRLQAVVAQTKWVLLFAPAIFGSMIAVGFAVDSLRGQAATPSEGWAPLRARSSPAELVGFVILALIFAPVAEEMCFRGLLYNKLRQSLAPPVALVLQAVAFGLAHSPLGVGLACATGVAGLLLGVFYEWRKSLPAAAVLHASVNILGTAMLLLYVAAVGAAPRLGVYGEPGGEGCVVTQVVPGSSAERGGAEGRRRDHGRR